MFAALRHHTYERAYLWAGRRFGFLVTIRNLEVENGKLSTTIEEMHASYMKQYRELEELAATVVKAALPELRMELVHKLTDESPTDQFHVRGLLMMANGNPHHQTRYDEVNCRTVVTTDVRMGFAFADERIGSRERQVRSREYPLALAFAKKAAEMAYDAVMNDLKFRPSTLFSPK